MGCEAKEDRRGCLEDAKGDGWLVSRRKEMNICPPGRMYTDQLSTVKDPETDLTFNGPLMIKAQGDLRGK